MRADAAIVLDQLEWLYAKHKGDIDFAHVLPFIDPSDDAALSELIEADGRQRLLRGKPVHLDRYLIAVDDLKDREDPLDAAIDVTLRSLAGSSRITPEAVGELVRRYPEFEASIREAAMLNAALWSTTGFRAQVDPPPVKALPCDFGAGLPSGERRYQLQQFLGQGGFGQVYLALDRQLSETDHKATVAIKILASSTQSPSLRQRLVEEATKVRRISHPNVVMVIDRGVTDQNEDYIVYEYVDGGDLTSIAAEKCCMPVPAAVRLMSNIARGVHAAHSAGVIHCDLKPGNIMMTSAGEPKVADFGVAVRMAADCNPKEADRYSYPGSAASNLTTSTQGPVGNLAFVSPEQYRGELGGLSVQSDVFALGGILYLMLTGELPNGATRDEIARTHDRENGRTHPPSVRARRKEIDPDLEAIVARAMALEPGNRYESAAAFAEDLDRWGRREPILWHNSSPLHRLKLWTQRKPALAAAVVAIICVIVAGAIVALRFNAIANANAIEAARAQSEIEKKDAIEKQRQAVANELRTTLRTSMGQHKFATDALAFIWALEYLYGPKALAWPDQSRDLWKDRVANIRVLVQTAHAEGRADDIETLLWESALAFWLVSGNDYSEAEPLLASNIERWSPRLAPNDRWLVDLRTMQLCAKVNRYAALRNQGGVDSPENAELRRLHDELLAVCQQTPENRRGEPMHLLIIHRMMDLCSPSMLNDAERMKSLEEAYKVLLSRKQPERPCG